MPGNFVGGFRAPTPTPPIPPPKDPLYTQGQSSVTSTQLTHMTAVERSQMLRVARLDPHLQVCISCSRYYVSLIFWNSSWLALF